MNEKVKLKVEYVKLEELIPFELNARTHSKEQVGQIVNSIGEFDFVNPILVGVDNMIIAGHGRLMAAKKAGLETVPIIRLPHLDYNQCMALSLADNKIADNAGWDEEKIVEIIRENFDLRPAGIIKMLDLRRPIYKQTAAYGHFGRNDLDLPWEKLDKVDTLKKYL